MSKFLRHVGRRALVGCALLVALFVLAPTFVPLAPTYAAAGQDARTILPQAAPADPACSICLAKARWWEWAETVVTPALAAPSPTAASSSQVASDPRDIIYWLRMTYQAPLAGVNTAWQIYYYDFSLPGVIAPLTMQGNNTNPRLSPDLAQIAFVSDRHGAEHGRTGDRELYIIGVNGAAETRLTDHPARDMMPTWSPDGQQLLFTSDRDGNAELYVMRRDGSQLRRLTTNPLADLYPTWSPDGRTIAWVRANGEHGDLLLMDPDGTHVRALQRGLRFLAHPIWSPASHQIAFDYDGNGDGFNEPYRLDVAGGTPQLIPTQDLGVGEWWIDSWEPNGRSILMTHIHFVVRDGTLLADNLQQIPVCIDPERTCDYLRVRLIDYTTATDLRSADPLPPTARLRTIAPLTRMDDDMIELLVTDQGGAFVKQIEMVYRQPTDTTWRHHIVGGYRGNRLFTPLPEAYNLPLGQYEYRIRAEDFAGNRTPWSATGTTFVYMKTATGQVTDNRGVPLVNVAVTMDPTPLTQAATDHQGNYQAYLAEVNKVTIQGQPQRDDGDLNYRHDFYRKPPANLMSYGDFEILALRGAWAASGPLTPTLQTEVVAQGDYAVRLGGVCTGLCLQTIANLPAIGSVYAATMDDTGVIHLVALINQVELTYWRRTVDGQWSAPELLYSGSEVTAVTGAVNRNGDFVTAWETPRPANPLLYLRKRGVDGQWTAGRQVAAGRNPVVLIDDQGIWHLFYKACIDGCRDQTIAHTYQLPDGNPSTFQLPIALDEELADPMPITAALTPAGVAHLVYTRAGKYQYGATVLHKTFTLARQTWSASQEIPTRTDSICEYLFVDHRNGLHLLCSGGRYISYLHYAVAGQWSAPEAILYTLYGYTGYTATMDRHDVIHLFAPANEGSGTTGRSYFYKTLAEPWSHRLPVTRLTAGQALTTGEPTTTTTSTPPDVLFPGEGLRERPVAVDAGASKVAQRFSIPADLHQPTLSFMLALHSDAPPLTSHFAVAVTAGVTTTTVLSTATPTDWRLAWVDLSPWLGETITLTFAVQQAAGEPYLQAYLDDVAVGAWETGVVDALEPATVPVGQATTVTARGLNLRPGLQLRLGQTVIGDVQVNENGDSAVFTVPRTLGPGAYPLYVTAAGQSHPSYGGLLLVGEQVWLPNVAR